MNLHKYQFRSKLGTSKNRMIISNIGPQVFQEKNDPYTYGLFSEPIIPIIPIWLGVFGIHIDWQPVLGYLQFGAELFVGV